jgi:SAM-dependent methyltransferase
VYDDRARRPRRARCYGARVIGGQEETCPVCAGALSEPTIHGCDRLLGTPGEFDVTVCARCGAGSTLPVLADEDLGALYPGGYGPHDSTPMILPLRLISRAIRARQARAAWREEPVSELHAMAPGRGLDVGCGRGDLDVMLMGHGWRMSGVEPSPDACALAASRGIDARCGTLKTVELEPDAFDAIIFRHSLEHTNDPVGDLRRVRDSLTASGRVLISVPNFGCRQAKLFTGHWYHLDLPRHRTHFTPESLRRAIGDAGLEVVRLTMTTSTLGLPGSVQYRLFGRCIVSGGLALRVVSGLAALTRPIARALNALTGGGDELQAVARRPIASSTSAATSSAGPG